jgi:hypothetical protein
MTKNIVFIFEVGSFVFVFFFFFFFNFFNFFIFYG